MITAKSSRPGTAAETPEHRLLLEVVDSLGVALAFFSSDGVPLHATSRLAFLLAQEPDGPALLREVQHFAGELSGLLETRRLRGQHGVEPLSDRSVVGCCGMYRLQGSYLGAYLFGAPGTILVTVEAPAEDPLSPEVLRRRWQLSKRQAAVAQLLAKGPHERGDLRYAHHKPTHGASPHRADHDQARGSHQGGGRFASSSELNGGGLPRRGWFGLFPIGNSIIGDSAHARRSTAPYLHVAIPSAWFATAATVHYGSPGITLIPSSG